jgi:hypothetical protein
VIALPEEGHRVLALGWATVELDRAARELAHLLAPGAAFDTAASSVLLGARSRSAPAAEAGLRIVLLETETEGRLAAWLARSGEGWAVTWALAPPSDTGSGALSAARPGPFGFERLRLGGGLAGPHRLVVEAVPSPP